MIKFALKGGDPSAASIEAQDEHIAPVPRISIQAFCESADVAAATQAASEDRRMVKAHLRVQMGGIAAAIEAYRSSATPNVVVIEFHGGGTELLAGLDALAESCDAGTRVIVIGHLNHAPVTHVFDALAQVIADRGLTTVTLNDVFTSAAHP